MQSCLIANNWDHGLELLLLVWLFCETYHFCSRFMTAALKGFVLWPFFFCIYPTAGCGVAARIFWPSFSENSFLSVFSLKFIDKPRILSSLFWLSHKCYYFTLRSYCLSKSRSIESSELFKKSLFVKSLDPAKKLFQLWTSFVPGLNSTSKFFTG